MLVLLLILRFGLGVIFARICRFATYKSLLRNGFHGNGSERGKILEKKLLNGDQPTVQWMTNLWRLAEPTFTQWQHRANNYCINLNFKQASVLSSIDFSCEVDDKAHQISFNWLQRFGNFYDVQIELFLRVVSQKSIQLILCKLLLHYILLYILFIICCMNLSILSTFSFSQFISCYY